MFIITNTPYIKVIPIFSHKIKLQNYQKLKKLCVRPNLQPPLYVSKEEWTDYYLHSFTSIKLSHYQPQTNEIMCHLLFSYNQHQYMDEPILLEIYFLQSSRASLNYTQSQNQLLHNPTLILNQQVLMVGPKAALFIPTQIHQLILKLGFV